jgi:hypothetical protein
MISEKGSEPPKTPAFRVANCNVFAYLFIFLIIQVVEHLSRKCEALSSVPSTTKKEKRTFSAENDNKIIVPK